MTHQERVILPDITLASVDKTVEVQEKVRTNDSVQEGMFDLSDSVLTGQVREKFEQMLRSNRWAFAKDISELGHFTDIPMKIEVDTTKQPPCTRPYRASPRMQAVIDEQVAEMLRAGVI